MRTNALKGKLSKFFIFGGFEKEQYDSIEDHIQEVTANGLKKLSVSLALLFLLFACLEKGLEFVVIDLTYVLWIITFLLFNFFFFRKSTNPMAKCLFAGTYIVGILTISLIDSAVLCRGFGGIVFPLMLLAFAAVYTGRPFVIETILVVMSVAFLLTSHSLKSAFAFRLDFLSCSLSLFVSLFINALNSKVKINMILKTSEAQESKTKYKSLYDTMPCGIVEYECKDGEFKFVSINAIGLNMLGYDKDDFSPSMLDSLQRRARPDDRKKVEGIVNSVTHLNDAKNFDYEIKRKDGSSISTIGRCSLTKDEPDCRTYTFAFIDVEAQKQAIEANDATKQFLSRMSHDMRTPMNGILGIADISADEDDINVLKDNMEKIKASGNYLLGLINDTLDFQRIQNGNFTLTPQTVKTSELIQNIIEMSSATAVKKDIKIEVINQGFNMDSYIYADPMRLKQVFINLLSNSIKFSPNGSTIHLTFKLLRRDGMIAHDVISIADSGIGMSDEFLKNGIFKPFSQDDNKIVNQYAGSGLGLSIAKNLVECMGGHIEVESELGKGTTFNVFLDFQNIENDKAVTNLDKREEKVSDYSNFLNGRRVLLAEDNKINAEIAVRMLTKAGCIVTTARNGQEAVAAFERSSEDYYDVILMDIRMPIVNGIEATRSIRRLLHPQAATIPIIAMTANAFDSDIDEEKSVGMTDHITKPITPHSLYNVLSKHIIMKEQSHPAKHLEKVM